MDAKADLQKLDAGIKEARKRLALVVHGQDQAITLLFVALAAGGHALIEGAPGLGKTTLAKAFAQVTGLQFRRIQLTPDLMPSDITGHSYYDQKTQEFSIRDGPVFTNVLLADELNRTPPRTQSALLEVMQESHVTIDGVTRQVPQPFFVVATKNPIETEGVFPLPEAERDRFMVHALISYPDFATEAGFLAGRVKRGDAVIKPMPGLAKMLRAATKEVDVHPDVQHYLLSIVRATREHPSLEYGASPRGGEHLLAAARAHAVLEGRSFVVPDDVRDLAHPVLRHRIMRTADAEVQDVPVDDIIDEILDNTPAPIS